MAQNGICVPPPVSHHCAGAPARRPHGQPVWVGVVRHVSGDGWLGCRRRPRGAATVSGAAPPRIAVAATADRVSTTARVWPTAAYRVPWDAATVAAGGAQTRGPVVATGLGRVRRAATPGHPLTMRAFGPHSVGRPSWGPVLAGVFLKDWRLHVNAWRCCGHRRGLLSPTSWGSSVEAHCMARGSDARKTSFSGHLVALGRLWGILQ